MHATSTAPGRVPLTIRRLGAILRRTRLGLRGRLTLLVAAIVTPLAALQFHGLLQERGQRIAAANEEVQTLVRSGLDRYRDTIEDARRTLDLLARVPSLTQGSARECQALLEGVEGVRPWATGFFLVGADGRIGCTTVAGARDLDVAGRDWYRQALAEGGFSVSDLYVTLVRKRAVAAASVPILAADGLPRPQILMVNLDLAWFARLAAGLGPRGDLQVLLVDGKGRALARFPDAGGVGEDLSALAPVRDALARDFETSVHRGADGGERLYGFRRLPGTQAHLIVSLDRASVLAPVETAVARATALIALLTIVLGAIIWLAGRLIFADPLQALTESLATTVNAMDQGLILVDTEGRVSLSNRRAAELLDLPAALMASRPPYRTVREHQRRALRWGPLVDEETPQWHLDEGRRSTFVRCERRSPNGDVLEIRTVPLDGGGLLQTFADITHLKRAEETARESEARYRTLADTLPQLVWITDAATGQTVYANRRFESYYGPLEQASIGLGHPDDIERMAQAWVAARAEGRPCEVQGRLRRHDGVYRWHKLVMVPLREGDGQVQADAASSVTAWLGTALDIDGIVSTRRALEETGTLLRIAQEAAEAGLWDLDLASFDILFSPESARLHGLPPDRPALMKLDDWIALAAPEDRDATLLQMREAITSCRTFDVEFRLARPPGGDGAAEAAPRWIQAIGRTYQDESGAAARMIGLNFDITARKAAEQALVQAKAAAEAASAAKTDFLAAMSHEIRTPLNAVIGFTDLLAGSGRLEADLQRYAEHARSAGGALLTVVDDILDFSKVEAGMIELEPAPFALGKLVDDCLSIVRGAAAGKGLELRADLDASLPDTLVGDACRLRQVLLNLLNNAVKFTPRGGVTLSVRHEGSEASGERIRFGVADTGIGIARDKQHRLFQRFSQVDGSIRRDFGGTGLGLAICSRLVGLMGGEIGLVSDAGRGATFWFSLTLAAGSAAAEPGRVRPGSAPRGGGRILLAEDSDLNRDLARLVLEAGGYRVDTVPDGASAVRAVASGAYDLVLMDVQMPGMDGMTATRAIRAFEAPLRDLPIVAMTANVLPGEIAEFHAAGMDDHIGKPFERTALYAMIERWLAKPSADDDPFDRAAFDETVAMVPAGGAVRLLGRFRDLLAERFAGCAEAPEDRAHLRREAHALISPAAMLGFGALSEACAALETCEDESGFPALLARVRVLADGALRVGRRLADEMATEEPPVRRAARA